MLIPGFTAESSVYRTVQSYRATPSGSVGSLGKSIVLQLDCGSKCTAEYTACLAGCIFGGGLCIPGCFAAFAVCQDGCSGGGSGGGGPGPNPRCGCPPGTVCQGGCVKEAGVGLICDGDCVSTRRIA
jgi:hypothetical protein